MNLTQKITELYSGTYCLETGFGTINHIPFYIIPLTLMNQDRRSALYGLEGEKCIFFKDEVSSHSDLCHSILKNKIGMTSNRIYARHTKFKPVPTNVAKIFADTNHISGHVQASYFFGLYLDSELVSLISFRKPFISKYKNTIEIARFCSKKHFNVVGGLSKLLHHAKKYFLDYDKILTYADRRFGEGASYSAVGFSLIDSTSQDYWYTDGVSRYHRFKFRAANGKSEKQVAIENGVFRVYGCGSNVFIREI